MKKVIEPTNRTESKNLFGKLNQQMNKIVKELKRN